MLAGLLFLSVVCCMRVTYSMSIPYVCGLLIFAVNLFSTLTCPLTFRLRCVSPPFLRLRLPSPLAPHRRSHLRRHWTRLCLLRVGVSSLDRPPFPSLPFGMVGAIDRSTQPFPLSLLGRLSVDHGNGPSTEAAAMVAVYVTANHLLDYFIPHVSLVLCLSLSRCCRLDLVLFAQP